MEQPLVDFLWCGCTRGWRRRLGWKSPSDVRAVVQAVRVLHFVEMFCGTGNLIAACSRLGLRVGWFDWNLDSQGMDLADKPRDGTRHHAVLITHGRSNRLVRRAVLDVCVHEPRPYASVSQAATWEHVPP